MDVVSGLDGFVERLRPYDWIVLDGSAFSIRHRDELHITRRERFQYKTRLLEHMAADKRFVLPIGAFNALNEGYYKIMHYMIPSDKRDVMREDLETELVLLAEQRIVSPQIGHRREFARFMEAYDEQLGMFDLYASSFDTLAKTLYLARDGRVAFLSNTTQQLNALMACVTRSQDPTNPAVYRVQDVDRFGYHLNPGPESSLQDLAVLPAPEKKVELVHVNSNLS